MALLRSSSSVSVQLRAKCIVAGDAAVGKSALSQILHGEGNVSKTYSMTPGVEILTKVLQLPDSSNTVEMLLYDSGGQPLFSDVVSKYWENPSLLVIVYDVTNQDSFKNSSKWFDQVHSLAPNLTIPGVLVANKTDLLERRAVTESEGRSLASEKDLAYFETSTKKSESCLAPFLHLAKEYFKLYEEAVEVMKTIG
ncbi:intraflagellar transport protein 27 homolog [Oscarella lobularis]|uniref:intraflagellar transport protein 27 homolog n=1 Tax=Oscarella lobularis TaxID=121494 RepID=UPI0033139C2F